jgi:hypothetical protein
LGESPKNGPFGSLIQTVDVKEFHSTTRASHFNDDSISLGGVQLMIVDVYRVLAACSN